MINVSTITINSYAVSSPNSKLNWPVLRRARTTSKRRSR
ncbi:hypothetical protein FBY04_103124 [Pseudomonas sp. SJZ080]|nr:hypothetical protein FBY04_103124 [Pseudomonas sp. SJZ080]